MVTIMMISNEGDGGEGDSYGGVEGGRAVRM